jgi:golgi SNAP receptor complex member 2
MIASVSELLPEEKRRLHELELQLGEVERNSLTVRASDVSLGLNEMSMRLDELDKLVQNEPIKRREDCRRRILHLRNTHQHIKASLDNWVRRNNQYDLGAQKRALFGNADIEGGKVTDAEIAENASLQSSARMMNDYIAIGQETLSNLISQKDRIKNVQRKVFDILNYLGLSNSIMRVVERRDIVDKWIVYIGMVLIIALLIFVYMYLR